jgi:hypothetical protein
MQRRTRCMSGLQHVWSGAQACAVAVDKHKSLHSHVARSMLAALRVLVGTAWRRELSRD